MKKVLLLLLIISIALADGLPVIKVTMEVPEMKQSKQVAFIDWDGEEYTTDIYVTVGPSNDAFYWVIPFEDVPEEVSLHKISAMQYTNRINAFRNDVWKSKNMKYLYDDASEKHKWVALTNPIALAVGVVAAPIWLITTGGSTLSAGGAISTTQKVVPIKSFNFGELGYAEVYDASGVSLKHFFQSKGVPVPEKLNAFEEKKIVVFSINRLEKETNLLASFRFKSKGKIFYPSSTTSIWKGVNYDDFALYIKTPRDYSVDYAYPLKPRGNTHNMFNSFFYYYGNDKVFREDIRIQFKHEKKEFKISQLIEYYIPLQW
ncbi:MAG: hypothetical protein J7K68_06185, partial [Candidatus Diapherotrites archaeon]|nr:hypothetical protein [Candidatus Diapherotrites archaeon]